MWTGEWTTVWNPSKIYLFLSALKDGSCILTSMHIFLALWDAGIPPMLATISILSCELVELVSSTSHLYSILIYWCRLLASTSYIHSISFPHSATIREDVQSSWNIKTTRLGTHWTSYWVPFVVYTFYLLTVHCSEYYNSTLLTWYLSSRLGYLLYI